MRTTKKTAVKAQQATEQEEAVHKEEKSNNNKIIIKINKSIHCLNKSDPFLPALNPFYY